MVGSGAGDGSRAADAVDATTITGNPSRPQASLMRAYGEAGIARVATGGTMRMERTRPASAGARLKLQEER